MIKKDGKWTFERKLKETPNFIPPALSEFIGFFSKEGYKTDNAENIYKGYEDAGWKDSQGKPIRNWKQKVRFVWFKPENKEKRGLLKTLN